MRSWASETSCRLLVSDFAGCESAAGVFQELPPLLDRSASLTGDSDYITGASLQQHANTISRTRTYTHTSSLASFIT